MMDNKSNLPFGFRSSSDYPKKQRTEYTRDSVDLDRAESSKGSGDELSFYRKRRVGAVKSKLGMGGECDRIIVKKQTNKTVKQDLHLNELLCLFRERCKAISQREKDAVRVDCIAMKQLTKEGKITKLHPTIGEVPGVKVGDTFEYRIELVIVGLHRKYEHGIDHIWHVDRRIATCIVASESHSDKMYNGNVLTYIGEGGKSRCGRTGERPSDQKLKDGNLALWNSMEVKNPVRVIKGYTKDVFDRSRNRLVRRTRYVYDGLYEVINCEGKKGLLGNLFFEFKLLKCHGQFQWRSQDSKSPGMKYFSMNERVMVQGLKKIRKF